MTKISSVRTKTSWNVTKEVSDAIELCKRNPTKMATIQVPNTTVRLACELMLNEVSMFEEAACRVTVEMATVH